MTQMRSFGCLNSGPAPDIKVSLPWVDLVYIISDLCKDVSERDTLQNVRRQCTRAIQTGLSRLPAQSCAPVLTLSTETITGNRKIKMNYNNYESSIVELHSVKVVGWPKNVKFINPSGIGTVGEIRKLRDALKASECHWVKLTRAEIAAHTQQLTERRQQGGKL